MFNALLNILLFPPVTFVFFLVLSLIMSKVFSYLGPKGEKAAWKNKPYGGGEEVAVHDSPPDYREFFPIAFFFTIMHVLVLVVATAPAGVWQLPLLYVIVAILSLLILFRR